MATCTVETGLLKKTPCGQTSVTQCLTCEQPLCSKHAVPQLNANGLKSGKFMCKQCDDARKAFAKNVPPPGHAEKKAAEVARAVAQASSAAKAPAAAAPKAPAPKAPAAPAPKAPAAAPAGAKPPEHKPAIDDTGPLEFTPSKPKPPEEKK
jgi:hypothetical protein